jgi:hypothetical protein
VGTNPTFSGRTRTVEAFVLDTSADLYGQHVAVDFVARIRGQEKFAHVEELVATMRTIPSTPARFCPRLTMEINCLATTTCAAVRGDRVGLFEKAPVCRGPMDMELFRGAHRRTEKGHSGPVRPA